MTAHPVLDADVVDEVLRAATDEQLVVALAQKCQRASEVAQDFARHAKHETLVDVLEGLAVSARQQGIRARRLFEAVRALAESSLEARECLGYARLAHEAALGCRIAVVVMSRKGGGLHVA